ncbi:MAG: YjbH domain-containing protein [Pseudomonadota bacterium]
MKKNWLFSVLAVLVFSITPAKANIQKIQFEGPVRLQQALSAIEQQGLLKNTYWPTARLIKTDEQSDVERKKQQVLAQLSELENYWRSRKENDKALAAARVYSQVKNWRLGKQYWGSISIEQARQELASNPLLPAGQYELLVSERPQFVYLFGLVNEPGEYQFYPGKTVVNWLNSVDETSSLLAGHNKTTALKINVDSEIETRWAYFEQDDTELTPGDILWLGFEPNQLPARFESLNNDIRGLLKHFVANESAGSEREASLRQVNVEPTSDRHWSRLDLSPTYSDYGSVGLLQNPTARMAEEGELAITYADMDEYRRYTVNLQLLPWLETTAFYTQIPNRLYSNFPGFSGDNILTDKGFDVKARLWKESYWLPEVSVGLRDLAGTGLFDAEYIVANKRLGPVDFSLGLGFGRIGSYDDVSNPICEVSTEYCERKGGFSGGGGQLEYDQWFTGPAAFFGGVEYQTPWEPLTLKAEYEGNDYSIDKAGVPIKVDSRWNFGANYKVTDWFDVQFSYERGNTFVFNFSLRTNFNKMNQVKNTPDKTPAQAPKNNSLKTVDWTEMRNELWRQGAFNGARFAATDDEVTMYAYHYRFRNSDEAYDRAARVLAAELPESVKTYNIVNQVLFDPSVNTKVEAEEFKRRIRNEDPGKPVDDTDDLFTRVYPDERPVSDSDEWKLNPDYRFSNSYGLKPFFTQDFGSPENFHTYQLGVYAFGRRWLTTDLELFAEAGFNLANNYDEFNFIGGGPDQLPKVRTQVRRYVQNDIWLDSAQLTYHKRLGQDWFAAAYAGYLERMFGGAGAEVLYRPIDSPWAFGAHVNRVKQRNFTGGTGFIDYEVTTGFVSAYYQMPWLSDSLLQLDFGQFLAGDKGVNVTFQKRFDSGVTAGAFAAFTDVSSEEYGEGSFTKGFFISIPFDLMSVRNTRERVGFSWIPLSRNGGQQLLRRVRLYDYTDDRSPFYNR